MRDTMTKDDEKLAQLIQRAGLPRNVARTLAYIRKKDEVTSVEIEKATGLRQPEVSIAMQYLRKKGWITKRDIKKEGKGRPVHGYRLLKPFDKVLDEITKDLQKKIKEIEDLIKDLKSYA